MGNRHLCALEYTLFLLFTWLSVYADPTTVIWVAVSGAFVRACTRVNVWHRLSCAFAVAAGVWSNIGSHKHWYVNYTNGPVYVFYCAVLLTMVGVLASTRDALLNRSAPLHLKIYVIRTALLDFVSLVCVTMSAYYLDVAATFVKNDKIESLYDTTLAYNSELCSGQDQEYRKTSGALYSNVPFTAQCASKVWEQNRTNLLVLLQVHIVFALLVRVPYTLKWDPSHLEARENLRRVQISNYSGPHQQMSTQVRFITLSIARYSFLFIAVTLVLDQIENWYVISRLEAVMFTLYSIVAAYLDWVYSVTLDTRDASANSGGFNGPTSVFLQSSSATLMSSHLHL